MLDELAAKAETTLALEASRLGGNLGGSRTGARRTNRGGGVTRDVRGLRGLGAHMARDFMHQATRQRHRPLK